MTEGASRPPVAVLRAGGTCVVVRLDEHLLPAVVHWGPDPGDVDPAALLDALAVPYVDSVVMMPPRVAVLPQHSEGWLGRPGLEGSRAGRDWSVSFDRVEHTVRGSVLRSVGNDERQGLEVAVDLEVTPQGLVRVRAEVTNRGEAAYDVGGLLPALPVPAEAGEVLDLTGRHVHEREPQRRPFDVGAWVREARGGRPGHDSATLLCAGETGFGFRAGRAWGVHLAWSGNQVHVAERTVAGARLLRAGELLLPGEVRLAPGETYTAPWLLGSWGEGLDALSARFHDWVRARPHHPRTPRPALLNTWESVYFDHDLDTLLTLAERAAGVGIERFVLDDGWFRGRTGDHAGLGDWYVDPERWPQGLHPLAARVRALGMDLGIWVEPEMVNLDSDLAREHPDWLLGTAHGPGPASRQQHVLDLAHPQVSAYLLERLAALVEEYDVAFLKWDHNRPLVDAGHGPDHVPGVHAQTRAAYALMAALRERFPALEIESCSAGGARLDLGVLEHTDRVWVSDCIDAHERHRLVRWTGLVLPPELMGTHVGGSPDHSTGRRLDLDFRGATALWGHLGVEWDLTGLTDDELDRVADWVRLYRETRDLLHGGRVVRADLPDPTLQLDGVVAADGSDALFRLSLLDLGTSWPPPRVLLPGLRPEHVYDVTLQAPGDRPARTGRGRVGWVDGVRLSGRALATLGLQTPLLRVDQSVLVRCRAVTEG